MFIAEYINVYCRIYQYQKLSSDITKTEVKQTQMKGKHLIKYQMFMKGRRHLRDIPEI